MRKSACTRARAPKRSTWMPGATSVIQPLSSWPGGSSPGLSEYDWETEMLGTIRHCVEGTGAGGGAGTGAGGGTWPWARPATRPAAQHARARNRDSPRLVTAFRPIAVPIAIPVRALPVGAGGVDHEELDGA